MNGLEAFQEHFFLLKRQSLSLSGITWIFNAEENLVLYCCHTTPALKLQLHAYRDSSRSQELLRIQACRVNRNSKNYEVFEGLTGVYIGAVRQKGLRTSKRDAWQLVDAHDSPIGFLGEENHLATTRKYKLVQNERSLAEFLVECSPLRHKMSFDFSPDENGALDRRLGFAAGLTIAAETFDKDPLIGR